MNDCDEYCANHGCNQGRNCPARSGGKCHCTQPSQGSDRDYRQTQIELLVVYLMIAVFLYFTASIVVHWWLQ